MRRWTLFCESPYRLPDRDRVLYSDSPGVYRFRPENGVSRNVDCLHDSGRVTLVPYRMRFRAESAGVDRVSGASDTAV
jgi:hypothetical protein